MAVASIGSGCAKIIADMFQVDQRTRGLYVQAGLSAAVGILLPSPILGLLLVQELSMASRPGTLTVSSVILQQSTTTQMMGDATRFEVEYQPGHDLMEQVMLAAVAAASSCAVVSLLFPSSAVASMRLENYTLPVSDTEDFYLDWLRAIPIGFLGGAAATLSGAMYLKWNWMRNRGSALLMNNELFQFRRASLLFAVLAGFICGILGFIWSYPPLFENGVNAWQNILEAKSQGSTAFEILHFGLHVVIGVSVCLGCGVLGGCVFPLLNVGTCLGVGISCRFFPMSLSVPCCMASCITGFVPAPFTVVLTISMMFDLDANQSTGVLIASMVSYTLTGGSGAFRRLGEYAWRMPLIEDTAISLDLDGEEGQSTDGATHQEERPRADYEIRQEIRSTIFGKPTADGEG
jgi:H+/Cl- antiporter ClcA